MYIHWTHFHLPKIFGALSFVVNPMFVCLAMSGSKSSIGNYRFLLIAFALFDMTYSIVELVVPGAIDGTGSTFVVFLTDGPFFESSWGQLAISIRCGFVALSYGILEIHFIYRFLLIFNFDRIVNSMFTFTGIIVLVIYFLLHGFLWTLACELFLYGDQEAADYLYPLFQTRYNIDSHRIPILISFYKGSAEITRRSWTGVLILTSISVYAVLVYSILGYKIVTKLSKNQHASQTTQNLQRQLFKALAVQTLIPVIISFSPCMIAWFAPAFGVDLGVYNNYLGVIALSAFPVFDPIAIVMFLPIYRAKLFPCRKPAAVYSSSL